MIASSNSVKALAISVAVLLHGAVLWGLSGGQEIEVEGGPGTTQVQVGASFADMVTGSPSPIEAQDVVEPTEPQEVSEPVELLQPNAPLRAQTPQPAEPFEFTKQIQPTVEPVEAVAALAPLPHADPTQPLEPTEAPTPPERTEVPTPPEETISAIEEPTSAVNRSLRPQTRSRTFEDKHKAKPVERAKATPQKTKKAVKKKATPQPQGNANQTATAGSPAGAAKKQTNASIGNAAASNYPGKVMRKISRVRKPRVGAKGVTVVAFTISANGGLAGVSVARSSGSSALDQAALRVIRKAAPFPPPPQGARRNFSIKIKGS